MTESKFKEELKQLEKERNLLQDKRTYLERKVKHYNNLFNRSTCPTCYQKIDWNFFKEDLPNVQGKLDKVNTKLEVLYPKIKALMYPIWEARDKFNKERNVLRKGYLLKNKNRLNRSIREYNKGLEVYMPAITDKAEQELWNWAMECQLANRDLDDTNEELMFAID